MLPPNFLIPAGIVIRNAKTYGEKLFLGNIWPEAGNASYLLGLPFIKIYPAQHGRDERNLFATQIKRIREDCGVDTALWKGRRTLLTGSGPGFTVWICKVSHPLCRPHKDICLPNKSPVMITLKYRAFDILVCGKTPIVTTRWHIGVTLFSEQWLRRFSSLTYSIPRHTAALTLSFEFKMKRLVFPGSLENIYLSFPIKLNFVEICILITW